MKRLNAGLLLSAAAFFYSMPLTAVELAGQVNIEHRQFFKTGSQVRAKRKRHWFCSQNFTGRCKMVMQTLLSHLSIVWMV